jgi:hypothetical protein
MNEVLRQSPQNTVAIVKVAERGYVPARRAGNQFLINSIASGPDPGRPVFVIQVDADTEYASDYIESMRKAITGAAPNTMVEGCIQPPATFVKENSSFQLLSDLTDRSVSNLLVDESDDVIIDDKVSGYLLADYVRWGGHRREFTQAGEEIHAETSRLFIAGKASGSKKRRVDEAIAYPSRRKTLDDPVGEFSTIGFPCDRRQRSGRFGIPRLLCRHAGDIVTIDRNSLFRIVRIRQSFLITLFGILPFLVSRSLDTERHSAIHPVLVELLKTAPILSLTELQLKPGMCIAYAILFLESNLESIISFLDQNVSLEFVEDVVHFSSQTPR